MRPSTSQQDPKASLFKPRREPSVPRNDTLRLEKAAT